MLLRQGRNIRLDVRHTIQPYGRIAPLALAFALGATPVAKSLIKAGARMDPRERPPGGGMDFAMLDSALRQPEGMSGEAVAAMLAAGVDPNAIEEGSGLSPLHVAVERGDVDAVVALLRGGARPNVIDKGGATPFFLACQRCDQLVYQDIFKALLVRDARCSPSRLLLTESLPLALTLDRVSPPRSFSLSKRRSPPSLFSHPRRAPFRFAGVPRHRRVPGPDRRRLPSARAHPLQGSQACHP